MQFRAKDNAMIKVFGQIKYEIIEIKTGERPYKNAFEYPILWDRLFAIGIKKVPIKIPNK